jgi:hypothetical protein
VDCETVTIQTQPLRGARLWRSWLAWVTLGEVSGFAVPALVGASVVTAPVAVQVPALLAAGVVEGAVLGLAQARVLRRVLPVVSPSRWTAATAAGAGVAWSAGLTPGYAWDRAADLPPAVQVVGGVGLGSVLLLSLGVAQWLVLRRGLPRAGWWVPATALAWLAGLAGFMAVSTPLWRPGQSWPVVVAVAVLAGTLMAAVLAAISGAALARMLAGHPVPEPDGSRRDIRTAV